MSPDFRYHVASLAGIFLALGIGILIGTAFVGAPVVQRLETRVRRQEDRIGQLLRATREQERTEEALAALAPLRTRGLLEGRTVLVVRSGDYPDAADAAAQALIAAGATVHRLTLVAEGWNQPQDEGPIAERARRLGGVLSALPSRAAAALDAFRREGLVAGDSPPVTAAFVVLAGGIRAENETAGMALARLRDVPLIEALRERGVTVVGAEPLGADISVVATYRRAGVATVDCIDRAAGRVALPFAVLGENAAFGLKSTADRVLPEAAAQAPDPPDLLP